MPFQVNCSELIADFELHDTEQIKRLLKTLVKNYKINVYFEIFTYQTELYFQSESPVKFKIDGIPLIVENKNSRYGKALQVYAAVHDDIFKIIDTLTTRKYTIYYDDLEENDSSETFGIASVPVIDRVLDQIIRLHPKKEIESFFNYVKEFSFEEAISYEIMLKDENGNFTAIQYGHNSQDSKLGWWMDGGFDHSYEKLHFLELAEREYNARLRLLDGGTLRDYERFKNEKDRYRLIPKREFTLSVNPSAECNEEPRCDYCYLQGKNDIPFEQFYSRFKELCSQHIPTTITFGYNKGYPAAHMSRLLEYASTICDVAVTARPSEVETVLSAGRGDFIDYLALSYDNSMRDFSSLEEMRKLTPGRIKIGVNLLMIKPLNAGRLKKLFKKYGDCFDQFHFLVPKNVPVKLNLEKELDKIGLLKLLYPNKVFIDECLKMVQSGESCRRGKELITLQPDGSTRLCSFAGEDDSEEALKECPYLQNG